MSSDEALIFVKDLEKTYGQRLWKKGFRALNGVSLEVGRGSVFGLLGPNGAGKTTLIKVLMGLIRGWKGEARMFGERAGTIPPRSRVGFLPEAHRLPGYLTGYQALELFGMYSGKDRRWLKERIPGWLERIDMAGSANRKLREYSKGMQQRIGLVQALIHEPELVFLDEPTDGVDPVGRRVVREIIAELKNKGTTVFINSHLLLEVERMCDRVVIMDKGKLVKEGVIDELTERTGRVLFEIKPVPEDLTTVLEGLGAGLTVTERGFELTASQAEQDEALDRLRKRGISILSVTAGKLSLEDAFIELVEGGAS